MASRSVILFGVVLCVGILVVGLLKYAPIKTSPAPVFVTEHGTGPDKWATAWLLSRHLHPESQLLLTEPGQDLPPGIPFDAPSAAIRRSGQHSAFEAAIAAYGVGDPVLQRMTQIIHDIEVNYWSGPKTSEAPIVDAAFRSLHRDLSVDQASPECYLGFFQAVYSAIESGSQPEAAFQIPESAVECASDIAVASNEEKLIAELPIETLMAELSAGKNVVFVDVREPAEYGEAHIPGAINLSMRSVSATSVESFKDADYVVSYCVKDFRGFEMARLLKAHGVRNPVILKPYGIQGWIAEGYPVVGSRGLASNEGTDWLQQCMTGSKGCSGVDLL